MLETLFDSAKQKGYTKLFLGTTDQFVAAQQFYEKNSFSQIDKAALPENFPIVKVDTKFYSCFIN